MKYLKRLLIALVLILFLTGAFVFVTITFYKKELTALLVEHAKTDYGLTLKVSDIQVSFFANWPHASIKLKNVFVASNVYANNEPVLKAGALALSFNLHKMIHKDFTIKHISIHDAEILMLHNENGERNFEFKQQPPDTLRTKSPVKFDIDKIIVRNVKFKFINKVRQQNLAFHFLDLSIPLRLYSDGAEASLNGKILVEELLFNPKNGAFLKNTRARAALKLNYIKNTQAICIHPPSYIEIEGNKYNITSLINLGEAKRLALNIESKKIKYERAAALLSPKIKTTLSNFEVKRPIDAKITLVVNLGKKEDPVILAEVTGENCDLLIGNSKIPYSELYFTGKIRSLDSTGTRGDMARGSVVFEPVKGKVYDFPFTAAVYVTNLENPHIHIDADLLVEANKIPLEVSKDFVLKGSAKAKLKYSGPTRKLNKQEFLKSPMQLNARVVFKNLSYKEPDRPYVYTVNGKAEVNNSDLYFEDLHVKTAVADALVKGKAQGFVPYLFGFSKGFKATVSARTERLDLNPLFADAEVSEKTNKNTIKSTSKKIGQSKFEFSVNLFAKRLVFRKFDAQNAAVDLFYKDNSLKINSASLNTCDGKLNANASIHNFNRIDANVSVQNVDVTKLFMQFENFGQQAVTSENLKGNISLDARFKTNLDEKMNLLGETMAGDVKLKLKNGHLINFEPVQNLSNFLFRNRDFNDVAFTELNESFKLRGYEMQIEELEIGSNILNLFVVDGLYNFKGNSNINILVPWNNLKKRGKDYIPKNSGQSAENTKGLKLNFNGPSKKMKISLGHKEQEKVF